jgi:hypothetical protein
MLAIPAGDHTVPRHVNVLGRRYLTGRVSPVHDWPVLGVRRGEKPEGVGQLERHFRSLHADGGIRLPRSLGPLTELGLSLRSASRGLGAAATEAPSRPTAASRPASSPPCGCARRGRRPAARRGARAVPRPGGRPASVWPTRGRTRRRAGLLVEAVDLGAIGVRR